MADTRAIKRLLRNFENIRMQVSIFNDNTPIAEIKVKQDLLGQEWKEFQCLERAMKGKFDDNLDSVEKIEEIHFTLREQLFRWERTYEANNYDQGNHTMDELVLNQTNFLHEMSTLNKRENEVRLPRVNIPAFSGKYLEFPSFRDLFEASIHYNNNISRVHKLQYLKSILKGEAYALINHIAVTDANYDEAWDKIKERYDKRKHVIHTLVKQFMEQPNLNQSCPKSLRHLSDTSDEVIRGLRVLGEQAESRDPWLVHILINKLDHDSKEAWAHETAEIDFPTINQLFTFLNKRSDALECLSSMQKSRPGPAKRINSLSAQARNSECSGDHYLGRCEKFISLSVQERKQITVDKKLCFNCLSSSHQSVVCKSKYNCRICRRRHHVTLHPESITNSSEDIKSVDIKSNQQAGSSNYNTMLDASIPQCENLQAILPTVSVLIEDKFGQSHKCRVLLDSGSESSFISENCAQRLELPRQRANVRITGITTGAVITKGKTTLIMKSIHNSEVQVQVSALIINHLPSSPPSYPIESRDIRFFQNVQLADLEFDKPAPVDILIGANKFFEILESGRRTFHSIVLQNTLFGWIVSGQPKSTKSDSSSTYMALNLQLDLDIDTTLRKFWELEEIPQATNYAPEDVTCEEFYTKTCKRQEDGRYVVRLPFKDASLKLGNSLLGATQRFLSLERKLSKNPKLREQYSAQIREYLEMGHMTEIPQSREEVNDENLFYLPHHSVIKEASDTTKLRVVFDGSSKTTTGVSLNDKLMVGPTIQPTLWAILMRFRGNRIAITADIERMYRQVVVSPEDLDYQRVLWRENSNQQLRHYRLTRVTFGLASSSYLAIRTLQQLARDNGDEALVPHILNDFYVDDFLSGECDVRNAAELKEKITNALCQGGFTLRKWRSNIPSLCDETSSKTTGLCSDGNVTVTVLGLYWLPIDDVLTFKVSPEQNGPITKRKIISEYSRVFDPLGFLSPSIVILKILFQKLWFLKMDWDDSLPDYFEGEYKKIRKEFQHFEDIKIQRFSHNYENIQIHGFADASEVAYCAVIYSRMVDDKGEVSISLLTSKTKVAPIKKISVPRLELCAAHLLSKLMHTVKETIAPTVRCFAWTDSSIVLAWLSTYPAKWKTFIANRTSQILDKFPRQHWSHVKSEDNPADHGSRGIYPKSLTNLSQWWYGPEWLKHPEACWPTIQPSPILNKMLIESESKKIKIPTQTFQAIIENDWLYVIFTRKSRLQKIFKIVAYVKRFIVNLKTSDPRRRYSGELKTCEIKDAEMYCIWWIQDSQFVEEMNSLRRHKSVNKSSKLLSLAPFIDADGILRVGGRLFNADCEYDNKHPMIIPANHIFTERLIWEIHHQNLHAGPTLTNNLIRQRYWIINGRSKIRSILKNCVICAKYARKTSEQLMGNLPAERITPTRPFTNCGVDFAGPLHFATKKGRGGTNPIKGYLCIFVCLAVKAIHIEPVSDLTSEAFLAALRRFTARRGIPIKMYSDNGSNFVGAKRILKDACELIQNINNNYVISEYLSSNGIEWHFIPPASPHFGGLWESAVKSVKTHLFKSTHNVNLTFEEMATLLCQVENILNSRPLCAATSDDSYEVLTPMHFLIGTSPGSIPETSITAADSSLNRWQRIQSRVQTFWKRYYRDYLNNLQQRQKWKTTVEDLKIGDIVLIKEDNNPVCKWPLGRIIQIHPGDDRLVRVVTIKTASTTLQRPITKLCKLPIG